MVNNKKAKDLNTEAKILQAAREIFHIYGFHGTRMQQIADKAGINKAMLNYYFRDKKKLFNAIFDEAIERIFPALIVLISEDIPIFDKIRKIVDFYIRMLMENQYLPGFVVNEFNQNPNRMLKLLSHKGKPLPKIFLEQVKKARADNLIIDIEPYELLINIISMAIFPILNKPIVMVMFSLNEKKYNEFMNRRKKNVAEFIIRSIKKK